MVAVLRRRRFAMTQAAAVGAFVALNLVVAAAVLIGHAAELAVLAIAVPALLALLRRPQRGILLLVIGIPISGLLLLVPHPAVLGGWKQFLVLVMLGGTFVTDAENRAPRGRRRPGWVIGLVPLLVIGAVSGLIVGGPRAFFGLRGYFFYLLVAWAVWRCPPNRKERDNLVTALMVIGVLEALYALFEQYLGPGRVHALGYEYNRTITFIGPLFRSFGTFEKPFGFAFFEMLVILIGLPHALSEPQRPRSRWFLLLLPIVVLGLASAVIRGAVLGLAAGLAYLGVTRHRIVLLALPIAVVVALLLPTKVVTAAFSSTSSSERVSGWHTNVHRLTVHPFGVGVGATGTAAAKIQDLNGANSNTANRDSVYEPDNSWFKILLELGVLGLWFFALVVVAILLETHRAAMVLHGADAAFASGVAAMVTAALTASFVASYFDLFPMDLFFWMLVSIVATMTPDSAVESRGGLALSHSGG